MATAMLTTLAHVKSWLNIDPDSTADDAFLSLLIRAASGFALNYMQRDSMAATLYNEVYDGYGNSFMILRQFPAIDVVSLSLRGVPVKAASGDGISSPYSSGYVLEAPKSAPSQQRLSLFNNIFPRERSSVYVSYRAGYMDVAEPHVVPNDPGPYEFYTDSTWLEDEGVTLADGTPLTRVYGDPADLNNMQYIVQSDGKYIFSDYQSLAPVLVSYSFVPPDVEQAVWELVGERYRAKDRIGVSSKALGGQETVSFDIRAMNPYIEQLLNPYKRVVPV